MPFTCTAASVWSSAIAVLRLRRRSAACAQDDNRRSLGSAPCGRSARDDSTKEEQNGKGSMLFTWSLYLCRRRPTLPHTFACSTIGPAGLNFRVRDGNGCFPRGKITGNLRRFAGPGLKSRNLVEPLDGTAEAVPFQSDLANAGAKAPHYPIRRHSQT